MTDQPAPTAAPAAPTVQTPAAAPPAAAPPAAAPPAAAPPAAASPPAPAAANPPAARPDWLPEGLPETYLRGTPAETIKGMHDAIQGFRRDMTVVGAVPAKPEDYAFQPSEKVAPYLPGLEGDKVFGAYRQIAHKHGLGDKQFQALANDWIEMLVDGQALEPPFNEAKEIAIMAKGVEGDAGRAAAKAMKDDNIAFLDTLAARDPSLRESVDFLKYYGGDRGHVHRVIEALRAGQQAARPQVPAGGEGPAGGVTLEQAQARMGDPRNMYDNPKFDPAFAKETDRLIRELTKSAA